ncbi:hypothetical protein DY000_02018515 [Brassica cretica]|uniref:Secreted protein n=1 Tax=Brassica cretica TaxID=69181 RepID=A0ABQ7DBN2_BRACR|nr:hypothetical protein DY000_02018515 [Brassica cretica]
MLVLFEFVVASILSSILLFTAYAVCGLFLRSMVVVDQVVSGNVSKILCLSDYEGSATGSLWCFLRVLGGGGLAVVWPRPFPCPEISLCSAGLANHERILYPLVSVSLCRSQLCYQ